MRAFLFLADKGGLIKTFKTDLNIRQVGGTSGRRRSIHCIGYIYN